MTRRFVITGGSGFLGRSLGHHLAEHGDDVVLVSRSDPGKGPWRFAAWDGRTAEGSWVRELDGADGVVNLAGRTVDCRKTPEHCDQILRSRVESTRALGSALRRVDSVPSVWVQMSTAHIYGDPPAPTVCDESSAFGYGLAPSVGQAWEQAFAESVPDGVRRVVLRTSFVLGKSGGAFPVLRRLARIGLGGTIGSGRQQISWIHELDMNRVLEHALADGSVTGTYVVTAPEPVDNRRFMRAMRRAVDARVGLPGPSLAVRFGAWLAGTDPELVLLGRACVPTRLVGEGFTFRFTRIEDALADLAK